ncbi:OmpA family protein [Chitinibacteraceae bacterium HSL-7]
MFRLTGALIALALLAGCATEPTESTSAKSKNKTAAVTPTPVPSDYVPGKPYEIVFDKLSVQLDAAGQGKVSNVLEAAKLAKEITIRGYCDRTEVGNAKAAAIARAQAVKDELIARGVAESKFVSIRFSTEEKSKHLAEVIIE